MHKTSVALLLLATAVAACGDDDAAAPVVDPGDGGHYEVDIDPANFVDVIDNPYYPLAPGSVWRYEGTTDGEDETVEITVLDETKVILGVTTVVVHDVVKRGGEVAEDTLDWFAQDADGNVWYFGEQTAEYEDGKVTSREGSWEAGVDGAQPGIVMPAHPTAGDAFRQEFDAGNAEDMFEVLALGQEVTVPAGTYDDVVTTEDWTPLEPDVVEHKAYAPGVGRLTEETTDGNERSQLVEFVPGS